MRNDSILSVEEITMKLIYRDSYLEQLKAVMNVPDIKVITGIRRSGKSKLMDAFSDYLFSQNNANVIRIRLNIREFCIAQRSSKVHSIYLMSEPIPFLYLINSFINKSITASKLYQTNTLSSTSINGFQSHIRMLNTSMKITQ